MEIYRFADVVKGARTTPKSLRRWFATIERAPPDGGWHEFSAVDVLHYAVMRHLVDWGVSVRDADWIAYSLLVEAVTEYEGAMHLPLWQLKQLAANKNLHGDNVEDLWRRLHKKRALVFRDNEGPTYVLQTGNAPVPAHVWVWGSFLGLDLHGIAHDVMNALEGKDLRRAV